MQFSLLSFLLLPSLVAALSIDPTSRHASHLPRKTLPRHLVAPNLDQGEVKPDFVPPVPKGKLLVFPSDPKGAAGAGGIVPRVRAVQSDADDLCEDGCNALMLIMRVSEEEFEGWGDGKRADCEKCSAAARPALRRIPRRAAIRQ